MSINELFDLTGKTAIVTASGQGMGQAIAFRLAEAGANVVVSHKHLDTAETTAQTIRDLGGKAIAVLTDVTNLEQLDTTVDAAVDAFGSIDILVNNAGGSGPFTPFMDVTPDMWQATMELNLKGTFFLCQKVAKSMVAAGNNGKLVNIASTAAFKPDFMLTAYNASKAGVISLTRSLSAELAPHGILVNSVVPGPIRTTNTEAIYDSPEIQAIIAQRVPLGKPGDPGDVANAVLFYASKASSHMTGGMIVVDGGFMWA